MLPPRLAGWGTLHAHPHAALFPATSLCTASSRVRSRATALPVPACGQSPDPRMQQRRTLRVCLSLLFITLWGVSTAGLSASRAALRDTTIRGGGRQGGANAPLPSPGQEVPCGVAATYKTGAKEEQVGQTWQKHCAHWQPPAHAQMQASFTQTRPRPRPGAAHGSSRGHGHTVRNACILPCPTGSRAGAPTAALPGGRRSLPPGTYHCPKGSRAGAPIAALPGGGPALLPCKSICPTGSPAGAPTAALPGGRRSLLVRTYLCPRGSPAGAPTAALPCGRLLRQLRTPVGNSDPAPRIRPRTA